MLSPTKEQELNEIDFDFFDENGKEFSSSEESTLSQLDSDLPPFK